MRTKVFLMQANSLQGTVHRMVAELAQAFRALGLQPHFFESDEARSIEALRESLNADEVLAIISMNLYTEWFYQLAEFCTGRRVPLFFYCFDNPASGFVQYGRLLHHFRDVVISLTGTDELDAAERLFGRPANFAVLRQAVAELPVADRAQRGASGLLIGNNVKAVEDATTPDQVRRGWERLGRSKAEALEAMIVAHAADPFLPLFDLARRSIPPSLSPVPTMVGLINEFDYYARAKVRADAITVLADLDVTICGEGWDYLQAPGQKARFLGSTPNDVCRELMGRANVLFNIVPEYYSCSERVLEAAMTGCPVITTRSRFFEQEFGDALLYMDIPEQLSALMAEAADQAAMAPRLARARAVVLERHTWTHRAQAILDILAERGFAVE